MEFPPPSAPTPVEHLLYRRQFILSTEPRHALPDSKKVLVGGRYHLSAHRDLELTHVEASGKSLTLLGFALDPDRPDADNEQILLRLAGDLGNGKNIFAPIETLGGRWVMIVHDGTDTKVLHDATAQRRIYFTRHEASEGILCGSDPAVMAAQLGLTMDPDAVDFIRSRKTEDYEIYWMPGDTSLFSGIKALLPNHFLSLSNGSTCRFWPAKPLQPINHDQALAECGRLLMGQMESARKRYSLAIPMTAGWDSRLVLALNQPQPDDIYAFTLAYPHLPVGSRDVAVPARLLGKLGIPHHVIPYPATINEPFKAIFLLNNESANTAYCRDIEALHDCYPCGRVCVTGDAAEIVKCYYERKRPKSEPISAVELAELSGLGKHPFAVKAFADWLENVGSPAIDLLDLFCWEQMAGRWQSKIRAEYDMVQDSFSPLNNRSLLSIMLSVNISSRRGPEFRLFADLIEKLWPEVLSEPINPPERISRPRRILNVLKKTGVLQLVPESTKQKIKAIIR